MSLITVAPPLIGNLEFRIKRPLTAALKGASPSSIQVLRKGKKAGRLPSNSSFLDCARLVENLSSGTVTHITHALYPELKSEKFLPDHATLSDAMLCYAEKGLLLQAHQIWDEILYSSFVPDSLVISRLINAYGRIGRFNEVINIIGEVGLRHSDLLPDVYSLAISCFGKNGQIQLMENMLNEMVSKGIFVDSTTWNAIIKYYCLFGSLKEIEHAYGRLKRSTILIEEEGIRAMSLVYLKLRKFYRLREFLIDVGLRRKNVGNLLWNLVLLSYAADFKMKSLQREFLNMLDNGFSPDLTTFNIRALAFSKMAMFWDLHLTLEHMRQRNVKPDLVTFGCVVDAYMDRRLGKNIEFACGKMNPDVSAEVLTDPLVFEVLGKGDFHLSSEAFLEFSKSRKWTYRKLIGTYLKKMFRRDQIFWNY